MAEFDLTGRVAWVTGGSKGLGRGMAEALASAGAAVALTARTEKDVRVAAEEFTSAGHQALALPGSVSEPGVLDEHVSRIVAEFGRLDVLVNCAGISPVFKRTEQLSDQEWNQVLDINLNGTFAGCRAAARHMLEAGGGSIINVSSVHAVSGMERLAPYSASKGAVEALTRTLAVEWADRGVRVNVIAPGYFRTDLSEGLLDSPKWSQRILAAIPQGRLGGTEDLAGAVVFLASDASRYVTGSTMYVDGGWTAK